MKKICYIPAGVCAHEILLEIEAGIVKRAYIKGGCEGISVGIARLVEGMTVEEVIRRLEGISCQNGTSCPDQLAQALKDMREREKTQH
ncbi:MAG: TIGR03905 family TSCPD domain-containing protein [Bacillota bacterium]|nr:TIGR03905 family TSCPD domain-containing protein [Negativicutes bacterium]